LDENYRFIIVGNRPDKQLLKYASNRVIITGFVEDICPYFENALCLVAPLVTGAGIKIKVLEAMSSGLTVLTNKIGIEGIPAKNKNDFLLCETEQEYVFWISELAQNQQLNMTIGNNGKEFIKNNYNYKQDMIEFVRKVELLCEETI
jgi:glycosyltransferase involved in cell wall biosynthesis